jgi:hypothetical protein
MSFLELYIRTAPARVTPALRFAAACSYLPFTAGSARQQAELLSQSLESHLHPDILWDQIRRHRIFALADMVLSRHQLRSVLGEHDSALKTRAQKTRLQAFILTGEAARLSELLSKNGITHHLLKGPQLSGKLYGDLGLRHGRDIDIIIEPRQLTAGLAVLKAAGWEWPNSELWFSSRAYRRLAQSQFWHVSPVHAEYKSIIEVHWTFEHLRAAKMESKWWTHWDSNGSAVSPVEALYLCLHGASHAWSRMKWLGDIRALLDRQPGIYAESWPLAKELGLLPILAQTLLLLEWLYDFAPDATSRQVIASERETEPLARFALQTLTRKVSAGAWSISEHLELLRYGRCIARRHGILARLLDFLSVCFLHPGDLLQWRSPPLLLFALPALRVTGFIQRRWLSR